MRRAYCDVAVPVPVHDVFTYSVPADIAPVAQPGVRVAVPFGARKLVGVVTATADTARTRRKLKSVAAVLDEEPLLSPRTLRLAQWVSEYYAAPIGEVFRSMLPLHDEFAQSTRARLTESGKQRLEELAGKETGGTREENELAWLSAFRRRHERSVLGLVKSLEGGAQRLAQLRRKGYVDIVRTVRPRSRRARAIDPAAESGGEWIAPVHDLTPEQDSALERVDSSLRQGSFETLLLHGVTGSGKTEVYSRAIESCLAEGKGAILLVPEIALTPAVAEIFTSRFGDRVAVLHSGLRPRERSREWWRVRRGEAQVAVGTRSAVFAPVGNLGLIIVDEEQDGSYKQGETPRYHGRDAAVVRAKLEGAVAVLGSATPALETSHQARCGRYVHLRMPSRVAGRDLAVVETIDMRAEFARSGKSSLLSRPLVEAMQQALAGGGQVLVLRNRRGYANFMLCRKCGATAKCIHCSISLTFHRRRSRLVCHYCGYQRPVPPVCDQCQGEHLYFVGEGTEKVEEAVADALPGARIARLDRDTVAERGRGESVLREFVRGDLDVLVGTQMIAKGHDFLGVTLVGVISADAMLALPDFRAGERTFQLITQVAGRAGRGDRPGRVLVQSYYPDHYAVQFGAAQDYDGFFEKEMQFRRLLHYPPFVALANVVVRNRSLDAAVRTARRLQEFFAAKTGQTLRVLGPAAAPISRLKGDYRMQFLIKSANRKMLQQLLKESSDWLHAQKVPPQMVLIDVDPLQLL